MLTRLRPAVPVFLACALALATAPFAAAPALAQPATMIDKGNFIVFQKDKAVGSETFVYATTRDSLTVQSRSFLTLPTPTGEEKTEKGVDIILGLYDYELRSYVSSFSFRGHRVTRGITVEDTSLTLFRELDEKGEGNSVVRPPGRFYVIDPHMYMLMDVICRSLHDKEFTSRPLTFLILAAPDTFVSATAYDEGKETVRWGARPVQMRKLVLDQGGLKFHAWADPQGRMIRLTEPESGLRVEREAPAVKPAKPAPKPGG